MRRKIIWQNADRDGIWLSDAVSLAAEFDASENDAESVLDELHDRLSVLLGNYEG